MSDGRLPMTTIDPEAIDSVTDYTFNPTVSSPTYTPASLRFNSPVRRLSPTPERRTHRDSVARSSVIIL